MFVRKRIHELAEMDDPYLNITKQFGELNKELWSDAQAKTCKAHQLHFRCISRVRLDKMVLPRGPLLRHKPQQRSRPGGLKRQPGRWSTTEERRRESMLLFENSDLESLVQQPNSKQRRQAAFRALKESQGFEKGQGQDGGLGVVRQSCFRPKGSRVGRRGNDIRW